MNYKMTLGGVSAMAMLTPSVTVATSAYQQVLYLAVTVGDKQVKAYESPDISSFNLYIDPDKVIPVYEMTVDGWCRVGISGKEYWVFRDDIQNIVHLKDENYVVSIDSIIDIYDGINKGSNVVNSIEKGDKVVSRGDSVYLFDQSGNVEDEFLRLKVENNDNEFYYAPKRYFEKNMYVVEEILTLAKNALLYKAPTSKAVSYGSISKGKKVRVMSISNGYAKINYNNDVFYIESEAVEQFNPKYMYVDRNKADRITVYESPTNTAKIAGYIYSDKARYVTNIINGYAEITYSGNTGYVDYDLLREKRMTETKYMTKDVSVKEKSSGSNVVGEVKRSDKVTILGYYKDTLARIKCGDITGYVSVNDVSTSKPAPFEPGYMYIDSTKASKVPVYEKASSSSKIVAYVYSDKARYVNKLVNGYAEVTYDGKTRYIEYDLLRANRITETKYALKDVSVKEDSKSTKTVGKLKRGDKVKVLGYYKDTLARVQFGDIKGYVTVSDLIKEKPKYMYIDRNKVDKVEVYEKASSSSKRLGYVYSDKARYVTRVINGYAEVNYDEKIGYIKYNLLRENRVTETMYVNRPTDVKEKSSGSKLVGKLKRSEKVKVLGYYKNTLARVEGSGIKGYIPVGNLSVKEPIVFNPKNMYVDLTKVDKITVYKEPKSSSSKLGTIYSDKARYVTNVIDGYAEITYDGKVGYVKYDQLRGNRITSIMYSKESVNLTEKANNTVVVGSIGKGQEVKVLGYYKDSMARVQVGSIKGYMKKSLLSEDKLMYLDSLSKGNSNVKTRYASKDKTTVYSDSSMKNPIGFLACGDKIEYIETVNSSTGKFKINDKLTGYINLSDVSDRNPLAKNTTTIVTKKLSKTHDEYVDTQIGKPYVTTENVRYYSNPKNYSINNDDEKYQFLKLDTFREINVYQLNEYLNNLTIQSGKTPIFKNQAQAFVDAARKNNIDPIYLVAHTMLETGYGSSTLAQGVVVTSDPAGNSVQPTKVYNLFGIGAVDSDAVGQGSKVAYALGWTDIPKAIAGAAKWIATGVDANTSVGLKASQGYIHSTRFTEQYNLYAMRWDFVHGWHQYATDVQWPLKISRLMNKLSYLYEGATLVFEKIEYKEPLKMDMLECITEMQVLIKTEMRSGPSENYRVLGEIEVGELIDVKGYVGEYALVEYNGEEYYILKKAIGKVIETQLDEVNELEDIEEIEEIVEDDIFIEIENEEIEESVSTENSESEEVEEATIDIEVVENLETTDLDENE